MLHIIYYCVKIIVSKDPIMAEIGFITYIQTVLGDPFSAIIHCERTSTRDKLEQLWRLRLKRDQVL